MSDEAYLRRLIVAVSLALGLAAYGFLAAEYAPWPALGGAAVAAVVAVALEAVRRRI